MRSIIIKIFFEEHAFEPPETASLGGLFRLEGGLFGACSPLRKFLQAPMAQAPCPTLDTRLWGIKLRDFFLKRVASDNIALQIFITATQEQW